MKKEHPEEAAKIEAMIDQLVALHSDLKQKAAARIEEAEQTQGQQMFDGAVKWVFILTHFTRSSIFFFVGIFISAKSKSISLIFSKQVYFIFHLPDLLIR